ncbi:MAG TPA: helix-turn-helix domain-containing protein [Gemmatimonadaceae bacterium]|nr:helix-turn-helix domain-containing protein [Gemmatimonadaceae bacterium]
MSREDQTPPRRPAPADWLTAVGHPLRVEILHYLLTAGTATPSEIAAAHGLPLGTVSYHVRFLGNRGIVRLVGRTQRRGASVNHYRLSDRERSVSVLWGLRAALLVTDIERDHGRSDATVTLDAEALAQADMLTADYLARLSELGLQTRERGAGTERAAGRELTKVAVLFATNRDPHDEPQ